MPCNVEADTLDDLMRDAFQSLFQEGISQEPTRGRNIEVIGARLELRNPRARLSYSESRRKPVSAIAELCWYLSGSDDAEMIGFWIPRYRDEAESDGHVHGAYGPRMFGHNDDSQVWRIAELLQEHPATRRAVIQLFDRKDVASGVRYKDVPCTTTLQFMVRADQLHMLATMRSNDAFKGLPHDIFAFTMVQEIVANHLNIDLGRYVHFVGSMHLYEADSERAEAFLKEGWQPTLASMPEMPKGAQVDHISEMLTAEAQLRNGCNYQDLSLPREPYWADLVRLLALHLERKKPGLGEAATVTRDITDSSLRSFAQEYVLRRTGA